MVFLAFLIVIYLAYHDIILGFYWFAQQNAIIDFIERRIKYLPFDFVWPEDYTVSDPKPVLYFPKALLPPLKSQTPPPVFQFSKILC